MSAERWATFWLFIAVVSLIALWLFLSSIRPIFAQEHHPQAIHEKFYSTWMMPDNRSISCCHNDDCSPAASKFESGKWYAMRDGEWIQIPENKIETERDSPDGRSHLCGKNYSGGWKGGAFTVFCFIAGVSG